MVALNYLTNEVAGAIDNYMSILSHIGYKSYCAVDKLLVFSFIEELLNKFSMVVTQEDYDIISKVVNCFYGSCMIPFPYYVEKTKEESYVPIFYYDYFRLTEDGELRITEDNEFRLKI